MLTSVDISATPYTDLFDIMLKLFQFIFEFLTYCTFNQEHKFMMRYISDVVTDNCFAKFMVSSDFLTRILLACVNSASPTKYNMDYS